MKKLTKEERLWNFLYKRLGKSRSADANRIYKYIMRHFGTRVISIKYKVDASAVTAALNKVSELEHKLHGLRKGYRG